MQPPIPPRSRDRLAGLRLPELPPRDLERLAAGPHSAPAPSTAPDSAGYLPPPSASPTKFGGEGSPADVRGYPPAGTPLLMRGGVVSPGVGGGSGLVLPTLSLPLSNSPLPPASMLPTVPLSLPNPIPNTAPVPSSTIGVASSMQSTYGPTNSLSLPHTALTTRRASGRSSPPPLRMISGVRTTPSSPVACGMSQNEIKKAQNRKSAKRFREAQKQRWKNMADDLMAHKRTIDELKAQIASQATTVAQANNALRATQSLGSGPDGKRSSMSINELVDGDNLAAASEATISSIAPSPAYAEAEAALYAQILSTKTDSKDMEERDEPYAKELGFLIHCSVVEKATARIVSARRGRLSVVGSVGTDGLEANGVNEYRNALVCGRPVAIGYRRDGRQVNAVINPVEASDCVVVAEFLPF